MNFVLLKRVFKQTNNTFEHVIREFMMSRKGAGVMGSIEFPNIIVITTSLN